MRIRFKISAAEDISGGQKKDISGDISLSEKNIGKLLNIGIFLKKTFFYSLSLFKYLTIYYNKIDIAI